MSVEQLNQTNLAHSAGIADIEHALVADDPREWSRSRKVRTFQIAFGHNGIMPPASPFEAVVMWLGALTPVG